MQSPAFAKELRCRQTDAEGLLWWRIRRRQLAGHYFRRQSPVGPYVVDFVCKRSMLVIEVDGSQHAERQEHDARRTDYLESQGYSVMRFWNVDVLTNLDGVVDVLLAALQTPSLPSPCRQGEE
ncbi:MAG: endonuclease domain-containing protein [Alphaproteobacteria bacterium]|nr:endonuclease domain-containing protein [Alphaproteobacteria bacterium]